ncbi:MAG: cyclic lactone autoinducer peptide [Clostridiales bacterium]|nr:cyclic lactone autoinducer peptide [Clostridiales bacterium]
MGKKAETSKEKIEAKALEFLSKFGELTLNNCCLLMMYEPKIPEKLMENNKTKNEDHQF